MKKIIITLISIIIAGVVLVLARNYLQKNNLPVPVNSVPENTPAIENNRSSPVAAPAPISSDNKNIAPAQNSNSFQPPLDRAAERVTKKPFGIYITPKTSPIQPERFQGYHTGTDFEIFPEELNADVAVHAIYSGKIAVKRTASGYGGVLVQNCELDNQPITVIYGHLKLASVGNIAGDTLNAGDEIGTLGKAYSSETDGERKHLHLGIHKGSSISILGYVSAKLNLSGWIDPCLYACK
jgi:hypothetical protein